MAINWEEHKSKIIALSEQGLSSTQIAEVLSKTDHEITPTTDRSIRRALQRWREGGDVEVSQTPAKILIFDIETTPFVAYNWNVRPSYLPEKMIIQEWYMLCWSAKWLFDDKTINGVLTPEEAIAGDDERITREIWDLLNEADIVIAHYGDAFDVRMVNGRFFKYNLNLPMPYRTIDTKKASSRKMRLPSHSLNYVARYLGLETKHSTDFSWWVKCMEGDQEHLDLMSKYCEQDVAVLEDVYLKMRPYIQPHPQTGFNIGDNIITCPSCGSGDLEKEGVYNTTVNSYDAFRCTCCGSISRSRKTNLTKEQSSKILSSVPR